MHHVYQAVWFKPLSRDILYNGRTKINYVTYGNNRHSKKRFGIPD